MISSAINQSIGKSIRDSSKILYKRMEVSINYDGFFEQNSLDIWQRFISVCVCFHRPKKGGLPQQTPLFSHNAKRSITRNKFLPVYFME